MWQRKELKVLVKRTDGQGPNPVGLGWAGEGSWIFFSVVKGLKWKHDMNCLTF